MLKNASEVTLKPEIIFFQKMLNFVQSFVECKVSLADGTKFGQKNQITMRNMSKYAKQGRLILLESGQSALIINCTLTSGT
jgi:hypothetical protein